MGGFFSKGFDPSTDLPNLTGKVFLVTGGNAGIGYETVKQLAKHGAKVYMAARSESKATAAIAQLHAEGLGPGNGEVNFLQLDLKDPRNAKKAAEEFLSKETRLDVIVHNAAMLVEPYALSSDGVQEIMVVNVISPFVLNQSLLPLMKETAAQPDSDVRIIVLGSTAHELNGAYKRRFRNLEELNEECKDALYPPFARYCLSKFACMVWANELYRRLTAAGQPITVITVHPGTVNTFSSKIPAKLLVDILVYPFVLQPAAGAYTSLFAAASKEVLEHRETYNGSYLIPQAQIGKLKVTVRDPEVDIELWSSVEKILKDVGIDYPAV